MKWIEKIYLRNIFKRFQREKLKIEDLGIYMPSVANDLMPYKFCLVLLMQYKFCLVLFFNHFYENISERGPQIPRNCVLIVRKPRKMSGQGSKNGVFGQKNGVFRIFDFF